MRFGPTELLIIAVIVLLLFGTTRLPKLARSMRQAKDEFEKARTEEPAAAEDTSATDKA